jgi:hypothetical protein
MTDKTLYDFRLDTGDKSVQCSRHIDVCKIWIYWKYFSTLGLEHLVEDARDNARYLAQLAKDHPNFELIVEPEYLTVCFFYIPSSMLKDERNDGFWEKVDSIAPRMKAEMTKRGKIMLAYQKQVSTPRTLPNFFRPSITLGKDKQDMDLIISELHEIGQIIDAEGI